MSIIGELDPEAPRQVVQRLPVRRTVVQPAPAVREVVQRTGPPGPPGPQGDPGQDGTDGVDVVPALHVQGLPAQVWTVAHGLGYRPHVSVLDSIGQELRAKVVHLSTSVLEVRHERPLTGSVIT